MTGTDRTLRRLDEVSLARMPWHVLQQWKRQATHLRRQLGADLRAAGYVVKADPQPWADKTPLEQQDWLRWARDLLASDSLLAPAGWRPRWVPDEDWLRDLWCDTPEQCASRLAELGRR